MATYEHPMVTDNDLAALSGRATPLAQRRWLEDNGIRYFLSRDGRPRTTWGAVDAVLVSETRHAERGIDYSAVS